MKNVICFITGNAVFSIDPIAAYLNSESFQQIQSTTWFAYDHTVNFAGNVVFESVEQFHHDCGKLHKFE